MLKAAKKFEVVFDQLEEDDPYLDYFDQNEEASDENECKVRRKERGTIKGRRNQRRKRILCHLIF